MCRVSSVSMTTITCELDGLDLGAQYAQLNVNNIGYATTSNDIYVTGLANMKSISPTSGSIYGGTVVAIEGNGFNRFTQVKFDTADCVLKNVTINKLYCVTSPHSAASNVAIRIR